ncbi:hypothetical protein GGI02_001743 [Coemansia sp. RSA 2322]|nr:hypothetical protein GGI02_001743 [Coemansia sp. RSA 2322]
MLGLVRTRKSACSPDSADSFSQTAKASSYSSISPALGAPAHPAALASFLRLRKRSRNDSDLSDSSQRMGIDLLLNASTLSDQMDYASRAACQMPPSPPTHAEHHVSVPTSCRSMSPAAQMASSLNSAYSLRDSRHSFTLPPISHLDMQCGGGSMGSSGSPPSDSQFGSSSLEAYKISMPLARAASSAPYAASPYAHSFPPPLSAMRSQDSATQHPSPPTSQHSSPTAFSPSKGPICTSSRAEAMPVPSSSMCALPLPSETATYGDYYSRQPFSPSPTSPTAVQPGQSLPPQQQSAPSTSSHVLFSQAQSYFAQHPSSQHCHARTLAAPSSGHLSRALAQKPPHPHTRPQPIAIHAGVHASLATPVRGNISKPKFNYAFMDTKRPRGPSSRWSPEEDEQLKSAVRQFGEDRQWVKVAQQVRGRTNLQCRQRWLCNIKAQVEKERSAGQPM